MKHTKPKRKGKVLPGVGSSGLVVRRHDRSEIVAALLNESQRYWQRYRKTVRNHPENWLRHSACVLEEAAKIMAQHNEKVSDGDTD